MFSFNFVVASAPPLARAPVRLAVGADPPVALIALARADGAGAPALLELAMRGLHVALAAAVLEPAVLARHLALLGGCQALPPQRPPNWAGREMRSGKGFEPVLEPADLLILFRPLSALPPRRDFRLERLSPQLLVQKDR